MLATVCESIMLICFGISWPISVYKSATSRSTKGKSVIFSFAIILGYIAGICGKILNGNINYVLFLYIVNIVFVSVDCALYFLNKRRENSAEKAEQETLGARRGNQGQPAVKEA